MESTTRTYGRDLQPETTPRLIAQEAHKCCASGNGELDSICGQLLPGSRPNEVCSITALDEVIPVQPHLGGVPMRRANAVCQAMENLIPAVGRNDPSVSRGTRIDARGTGCLTSGTMSSGGHLRTF